MTSSLTTTLKISQSEFDFPSENLFMIMEL